MKRLAPKYPTTQAEARQAQRERRARKIARDRKAVTR
jgi:hypothetical protein